MTALDPCVTLTEVLASHVRLPMMHSQGCSCGWHASLSHPDLHRTHLAERLEEHIAARLAPIRALAEEGYNLTRPHGDKCETCGTQYLEAGINLANLLRTLDALVSASQDHDGAEGQGEGGKAGEGVRCNRHGQLDRSVCGFCHDAYVECTRCGVYSCPCNTFPCEPEDAPR